MLFNSFKTYSPATILKVVLMALFLWSFSPLYRTGSLPYHGLYRMPIYALIEDFTLLHYFLSAFISLLLALASAFFFKLCCK